MRNLICWLSFGFLGTCWIMAQPDPATVYAWYAADASLVVGADNYLVTTWSNLGTAATNTASTQASRKLSRVVGSPEKVWLRFTNGAPAAAVQFDGADAIWCAQADFGSLPGGRTLFAMVRVSEASRQGFLFDSSSYTVGLTRMQVTGENWQVSAYGPGATGSATAPGTVTAPATTNLWQVHALVVTTNTGTPQLLHYINGVPGTTVANSVAGALGGLILGMNASAGLGIQADIAEFLVFNTALSDTARTNIEGYLTAKWTGVLPDTNAPPRPVSDFVRVFAAGKDGYTCFRIPALVTTTRGTLIAATDGRIGSCGDIPTPLDLVCKRSFDNGKTWGPLQVIANYGSDPSDTDTYPFYGATNINRVSAGDAALLVDRANGRIWTLYDNGGTTGSRKIKLELRYSDDDGATWSPAIDLEAANPAIRPTYGEFLTGPGNGIQLAQGPYAGRLIFPVYIYGSPSAAMAIYSDDHGATWKRSTSSVTYGGEIQVAELPGGELLASIRDNGFPWSGVRTFSRSTDGGVTWGAPYTNTLNPPSIPDPQCQGNVFRLSTTNDSNASRLIHANASHASSRVNMTLRISYDEGLTWPVSNLVYAGGSAYSSVARLANGDLGLLFEKDPYGSLDFVRRSVSKITGGADKVPAYTEWAGEQFTPAQLSDPAISGPQADPDADGMTNQQEATAGTNPLSAASRLELRISPAATNSSLYFQGLSNKSYTVQFREHPAAGTWQRFADVAARPSNFLVQLPASNTNPSGFYRLVTPQLAQ